MDLTSNFLVLSEINSKHVYIIHLNEVSEREVQVDRKLAFLLGRLNTPPEQLAFPRMQNELPMQCTFHICIFYC